MILTGKAVDYAEEFESLNAKIDLEQKSESTRKDLTEIEQINLYTLQRMAELDEGFRLFIQGCLLLFAESVKEHKESELISYLIDFKFRRSNG